MTRVRFLPPEPGMMPADEVLNEIVLPESKLILAEPLEIHAGDRIQIALLSGTGIILGVRHYKTGRR